MKKIIILSIFLLGCYFNTLAQKKENPVIFGIVIDKTTQQPLPYASVWLYNQEGKLISAIPSDSEGSFSIRCPKTGYYNVVASFMQFTSDTINVYFVGDSLDAGALLLSEAIEMEEAVVTANRDIVTHEPDRLIYDVSRDPEAKRLKMMEVMEKVPSMTIKISDGKLSFMEMDVQTILINGERNEMINSRMQFPMSRIRGDVMSRIEVIPPGSPEYNNSRPIINIITTRPLPNGFALQLVAMGDTKCYLNGDVNFVTKLRNNMIISFGYKPYYNKSPKLHSYSLRESLSDNQVTLSVDESKLQWGDAVGHLLSLRSSFKLFDNPLRFGIKTNISQSDGYSSIETLITDTGGNTIEEQKTTTHNSLKTTPRLSGDLAYIHSLPLNMIADYSYTYNDNLSEGFYNSNTGYIPIQYPLNQKSKTMTGSTEHAARVLFRNKPGRLLHRINGSISYTNRNYTNVSEYEVFDPVSEEYIPMQESSYGLEYSQKIMNFGAGYNYNGEKIRFSARLSVNNEVNRGIFKSTGNTPLHYNRWQLSPNLGISYSLTRLIRVKLGYELRTVRPDIDKLNPYTDNSDPMNIVKGNPLLDPEKSHNIRLGATYGRQPQTKGVMKAELLFSSINNAIEQVVSTNSDGVSTTSYYNLGKMNKASVNILHMQPGILKWMDFWQMGQYNYFVFDSSNPHVGTRKTHTLSYDSGIRLTLLPVTELTFNYIISSNVRSAQSIKTNIYHTLNLSLSQVLIKGKLYGSISLKDPFEYHRYLTRVIGNDNFRQTTQKEQRGYIVGFSIRWNFGRFKDRIDGEPIITDDRTRAAIENKLR